MVIPHPLPPLLVRKPCLHYAHFFFALHSKFIIARNVGNRVFAHKGGNGGERWGTKKWLTKMQKEAAS